MSPPSLPHLLPLYSGPYFSPARPFLSYLSCHAPFFSYDLPFFRFSVPQGGTVFPVSVVIEKKVVPHPNSLFGLRCFDPFPFSALFFFPPPCFYPRGPSCLFLLCSFLFLRPRQGCSPNFSRDAFLVSPLLCQFLRGFFLSPLPNQLTLYPPRPLCLPLSLPDLSFSCTFPLLSIGPIRHLITPHLPFWLVGVFLCVRTVVPVPSHPPRRSASRGKSFPPIRVFCFFARAR